MKTFTVRTLSQAAIFEHELKGQLSDGHWENSRPADHWKNWCEATVLCSPNDPSQIGRNFHSRRSYDFANRELLSVVEKRMILYVRIADVYGMDAVATLSNLWEELSMTWTGLPKYEGDYYRKVYDEIVDFAEEHGGLDAIKSAVEGHSYGHRELMRDLKELNAAAKIVVRG